MISEYPAWPPGLQSALLEVVHAAHLVHGRVPHVTTVHAGLEAGEIAAHLPGLVSGLSQRFRRWGHAFQHLHEQSFGRLYLCPPQRGRGQERRRVLPSPRGKRV